MTELTTEYLDLEDIRIAYCQHGSGENLILLHGNSESKRILRHFQLDHFPDFHTWALDSRGHGESVSNDAKLSIEQLSQDVTNFCNAKGISKAYVIGYSDGEISPFGWRRKPRISSRGCSPSRPIPW